MGGHFRHLGGILRACPPFLRKFLRVPMGHDSNLNVKFVENTSSIYEIDTGRDLWFNNTLTAHTYSCSYDSLTVCLHTNTLTAHKYSCSYDSLTVCLHMSRKSENP